MENINSKLTIVNDDKGFFIKSVFTREDLTNANFLLENIVPKIIPNEKIKILVFPYQFNDEDIAKAIKKG